MYKYFDENKQGNDYVVGDIHGCYDELMAQLSKLNFDKTKDRLFSVGDLVDRGPKCVECLSLTQEPWFHSVLGNHEQMLLERKGDDHAMYGDYWFITLPPEKQNEMLCIAASLPIAIEVKVGSYQVGIVHGDCTNQWEHCKLLTSKTPARTIAHYTWSRTRAGYYDTFEHIEGIDHVFFGHTPASSVRRGANFSFIDTGAVFGGQLTVLNIKEYLDNIKNI